MGSRTLPGAGSGADRWFEIKSRIHGRLINSLTPDQLKSLSKDGVRETIGNTVEKLITDDQIPMTLAERERLVEEVLDEVFGLGPLEPLLKDSSIGDILVNGFDNVYIERAGKLVETNIRFRDQAHLRMIIDRIVSNVGRRIDDSSPIVDARLEDGSRVCAVIPPLSLIGPVLSIRRFGNKLLSTADLLKNESLTPGMLDFLRGCVQARLNILVAGGSGSGKTTLLNTLSRFIPEDERVVTIEDTAELQLQQSHVVRLETRPMNIEGAGAITQRDLVVNALRMRPDRIIVGECRGPEAFDMMQAMNTGHDGSMTTTHANSARDAFSRVETMVMMVSQNVPDVVIRHMLASAIQVVIHCARLSDGTRKLTAISEVTGVENDEVVMRDIFVLERKGMDRRGRVQGRFAATGAQPFFLERLRGHGVRLAPSTFTEVQELRER
jgi:pilus assembly protein CpaF